MDRPTSSGASRPLSFSWEHVLLAAALSLLCAGEGRAQARVTFAEVSPILHARCVNCHDQSADAPFSLVTYDEARRRATQIGEAVRSGYMPPWKPAGARGEFIGDRRLSRDETDTLLAWVDGGALPGPASAASLPIRRDGWRHGPPDLILELPAFTLPAAADGALDLFRNFVVPAGVTAVRYVRGYEFRPHSRAVHHANIRLDRTAASRALDEADPDPGYEGLILHSAAYPHGHFLGWTPGQAAPPARDTAWRLDPGADFVVQLHMQPTGKPERVAPVIGLYLTDTPAPRTPSIVRLGRQDLDLPAGTPDTRVRDEFELPVATELRAVQAHAHQRAREVMATATLPDGTRKTLLHIPDWDFAWQDQYHFAQPVRLPARTRLAVEYRFDNSAANVRNPIQPPQRALWGWRTVDEMGDVWFQMVTASDADRSRLDAAARGKMLEEDAIGTENLVRMNPRHAAVRNDAALIYMELGRPADAIEHFAEVVRMAPESASARYNLGVAMEAAGRLTDAAAEYDAAVRLNPAYSAAHNNRGNLLARAGHLTEAARAYRAAVESDPGNHEARLNLGRLLLDVRTTAAEGFAHVRGAAAGTASVRLIVAAALLLTTHPSAAADEHAAAVAIAERSVMLTHRTDPAPLEALGLAYAAAGRLDDAISVTREALRLVAEDAPEWRRALEDRLVAYRR